MSLSVDAELEPIAFASFPPSRPQVGHLPHADAPTPCLVSLHCSGAASVILMSHLGRPDGHVVDKYSLKPVVRLDLLALLRYQLSPLPKEPV